MTEIYAEISKLSSFFRKMCYGITQDEEAINDACQEMFLYFLQMNPDTLKSIWEKDGKEGIIRYGAVALRRSLTSPRSNFYYKYKKYYTRIDGFHTATYDYRHLENKPENIDVAQWEKLEQIDIALEDLHWYDRELFKLYYYEGNTLDSLAAKTNISRNSLFTTIDKVRDILKKELVDE